MAINVKMGEPLDDKLILALVKEVLYGHSDFDYKCALAQLDNLKVINSDTIASVKDSLSERKNIYEDLDEFDSE